MSGTHSIFAGAGMLGLATAFATSLATSLACSSNDTPRGGDIPPLPPPLGTENASVCANFMGTTADPTVPWVDVTHAGPSGRGRSGSL